MNYKGAYDEGTSYAVGDVAVYTDGVPYVMFSAAPSGTPCHNVMYWERVPQILSEVVVMFHGYLENMIGSITDVSASIPTNISDEAITLKTETADYLITVDDSGETPELEVTAIEEEGAEEGADT